MKLVDCTTDQLIYIFISFQHFCDYCGDSFNRKAQLKEHILNVHFLLEKVFKCDLCVMKEKEKEYKNKKILYMHISNYYFNHRNAMQIQLDSFKPKTHIRSSSLLLQTMFTARKLLNITLVGKAVFSE